MSFKKGMWPSGMGEVLWECPQKFHVYPGLTMWTSFGKRVFEDVATLRWEHTSLELIHGCCPYKKSRQTHRGCPVTMVAEIGWSICKPGNAKGCQQLPEARRGARKGPAVEPSERAQPCPCFDLRLVASRTEREHIPVVLSHQVCGIWLCLP